MDSTHAAVGVSAGGAVGILTGLIAGTWKLDPTLASDWAMAVVGTAGFAGGWLTWFIRWKWPSAPPLPGDTITLAGPVTATVAEPAPVPPLAMAAASPIRPLAPAPLPSTIIGIGGQPIPEQGH
jgi:hypothetical protein